MLRFFRKYILNKWVLAAVGCVLMAVFLIQGTLNQLIQNSYNVDRGTLDGKTITTKHERAAASTLYVLSRLPVFNRAEQIGRLAEAVGVTTMRELVPSADDDGPLRWLLIMHDARKLGLDASEVEVNRVLEALDMGGEQNLAQFARTLGVKPAQVRRAIADWIIYDQYVELMLGTAHTSPEVRLSFYSAAGAMLEQNNLQFALYMRRVADGAPRLSLPLVEHYLQDSQSTVAGRFLLISADEYLDRVAEPSEQEITDLYGQYREDLPAASQPYGFGYKSPDRVKLQYLTVPFERCREQVEVAEADALEFFQQNKAALAEELGVGEDEDLTYADVRRQIINSLRARQANELSQQITRAMQAKLMETVRALPDRAGYRVIPDNYTPPDMQPIAEAVEAQFGVELDLYLLNEVWVDVRFSYQLPVLGLSVLESRPDVPLGQYLMSAKEMDPGQDNDLLPLHLQAGIPSQPMMVVNSSLPGFGSRSILRLNAAEPARLPESLEAVRDRVVADAKKLAAYRLLLEEQQTWLDRAQQDGLDALAGELDAEVVEMAPTSRRAPSPRGGMDTPVVPGIGQSDAFMAALIDTAEQAATDGDISDVPPDELTGAVGIDRQMSLAVFIVDEYQPLSRFVFDQMMQLQAREIGVAIDEALLQPEGTNPLSLDALAARVGFEFAQPQEASEEEEASPPADDADQTADASS